MANFKLGDKVKIVAAPDNWQDCTKFTLLGAEGTVSQWIDWPDKMDPFSEYIYVTIDKARGDARIYEGTSMLFHDHTLKKIPAK